MRIAISNIAWSVENRDAVAELLCEMGVRGVELAPTKVWDDPLSASRVDVAAIRDYWGGRGIEVVALQALLYGRDDLEVFGPPEVRGRTLRYLKEIVELAGLLGAGALVFGSPLQRGTNDLPEDERAEIAVRFFAELGRSAVEAGTCFCIEPNPPEYGTDFVNTVAEARDLVDRVGSPGFQVHLDTAASSLAGEEPGKAVEAVRGKFRHVHVSEPYLAPVSAAQPTEVRHREFATALRGVGYDRWCSIEMRPREDGRDLTGVREAVEFATEIYGEDRSV